MFLINFANIFPRFASTTAFLCLVVAHLEWPDITPPSSFLLVLLCRGPIAAAGRRAARPTAQVAPRRCRPLRLRRVIAAGREPTPRLSRGAPVGVLRCARWP